MVLHCKYGMVIVVDHVQYRHLLYCLFVSVLRPFQGYFSSYETGLSVGGAKTGEPREKPSGTPASRTWLAWGPSPFAVITNTLRRLKH